MSSLNGLTGAPLQFNADYVAEQGVQALYGSFVTSVAATTATIAASARGSWFIVTRIGAGQHRVTLVGLNPNPALVPVQTLPAGVNGQPNGLLLEAVAYLNTETVKTAPVAANVLNVSCSKFDTSDNSFDIFTSTGAAGAAQTLVDPTTASRVNFELSWKVVANLP